MRSVFVPALPSIAAPPATDVVPNPVPLAFRGYRRRGGASIMTARTHVTRIHVEFGDCDPAGIVFYPNFFRWMDASAWHFFGALGIARWDDVSDAPGLIGIPLVDAGARFLKPASYGDDIDIETSVVEWRERSFVLSHVIRRGSDTLAEGREVRVFACAEAGDRKRLRAVQPPTSIRQRIGS